MNKIIALLCAAVLAISSSAAIVMADESDTSGEEAVEEVVDTSADDAGENVENTTDAENTGDVNNEDKEQSSESDTENTDQTADNESNTDQTDDKGQDADTDNVTPSTSDISETTETTEITGTTEAAEASEVTDAIVNSGSSSSGGGGSSSTETDTPSATSDPSAADEPTATADPSATDEPTAIPEAAEKSDKNEKNTETKTVTVMKKPFTLVKTFGNNPFEDCQSGWFKNYVSFAYANGIIKGYNNNTFDPYGNITGEHLAVMLYRVTTGKSDMVTEGDAWADEAMEWVKENAITSDFAGDNFNGKAYLIREEIICMIYRAYTLYNEAEAADKIDVDKFPDAGEVSDYAETAMRWAVASRIITGKSDKWIDPLSNVTRAETATIFERYLENLEFADVPVEIKVTETKSTETDTTETTNESAETPATDADAAEAVAATDVAETAQEAAAEPEAPAEPEALAEPASAEE